MSRWHILIHRAEAQFDRARSRLERFDDDPLLVQSYLGYGTSERAYVLGRVLESKGITPAEPDDSVWENLRGAWRRFRSSEVPGARLEARFGERRVELVADEEGHLAQWVALPDGAQPDEDGLLSFDLTLLAPRRGAAPVSARASVLIPPPEAQFGVVSDIDDTVLRTGATDAVSILKQVLLGNAYTRLPFEGVAAFYAALNRGGNPLFYVSSSPWNLYDVLMQFFELNDVPLGPLALRDWGVSAKEVLPTSHGTHKRDAIRRILDTYPRLPFILIGDSGQEDPEIYAQVVRDYGGRILGVYIRDVSGTAERRAMIQALAGEVRAAGSTLLLTEDTEAAAAHAAAQGWIAEDAVAEVAARKHEELRRA